MYDMISDYIISYIENELNMQGPPYGLKPFFLTGIDTTWCFV